MKEITFFRTGNANSWSAKTPKIEKDGDFYLYGNDINRGLDVYRFEAQGEKSKRPGSWKNKQEAESLPQALGELGGHAAGPAGRREVAKAPTD